jgi:hypothetical protein
MYLLQQNGNGGIAGVFMILGLTLRIVGLFYCKNKAKELNRSSGGWGTFGFISPILAMILISFMKPIIKWEEENN